jgi:hypothetical protein
MRDVTGGPDAEVTSTLPTLEDAQMFEEMLEQLELAGLCRYKYHHLGRKLFGAKFTFIDDAAEVFGDDSKEWP